MMPRPSHEPTAETRQLVQIHATVGTPQNIIADILDIDDKTLRKHYRVELDQATSKANGTIGGALFNKAKKGDTAAMIFWMKTRAGWRERKELNHLSEDGSMSPKEPDQKYDWSRLTDEEMQTVTTLLEKAAVED